jgi:predicted AlkP superfamily phosphohydrolase/phosphomutase
MARRGFILGLDGENLELLTHFAEIYEMPTIRGLLARGRKGALDPWINPLTPPAWSTMLTGTWFPRHGVAGFVLHDPATRKEKLARIADLKDETLLTAADRQGAGVISINMPMTFPPLDLEHGAVVSGFDHPGGDAPFARPLELEARIRTALPDYECMMPPKEFPEGEREGRAKYLRVLARRVEERLTVLDLAAADCPARLFIVQCQETDLLHHSAMDLAEDPSSATEEEARWLRAMYEGIDRLAARLVELTGGDEGLGLILSDHGGIRGRAVVHLNNLLVTWGYAVPIEGANGMLARPEEIGTDLATRARRRIRRALGRPVTDEVGRIAAAAQVNREIQLRFGDTRLYVGMGDHLGVVFRADGPALSPGELDEVTRRILDFRLPDGTIAFREVLPGADVFPEGIGIEGIIPVLVVVPEDGVFIGRRTGGKTVVPYHEVVGAHRRYGVYCFAGQGVKADAKEPVMPLTAVFPTMFEGLGLAYPEGLDAEAIPEVTGGRGGGNLAPRDAPSSSAPEPDAEEEEELRQRLKDLGYMA